MCVYMCVCMCVCNTNRNFGTRLKPQALCSDEAQCTVHVYYMYVRL